MPKPGPIVIAGMHRSRTSLVALCLGRLGIDLGTHQHAADRWNPAGYGEDKAVIALHRSMLGVVNTMNSDGESWPDWGWPQSTTCREVLVEPMQRYVASRVAEVGPDAWAWGWKDPRTTLFLPHWAAVCPTARFLLLYRSPAGVAASMSRLPLPAGVQRQAAAIWKMYNGQLVELARVDRQRTIVVNTDTFVRNPRRVVERVVDRFDLGPAPRDVTSAVEAVVDQGAVGRSLAEDGAGAVPPELAALWDELEALDESGGR